MTGSFVVTAVGAFYTLRKLHAAQAQFYLRTGTFVALIASVLVAFPTGDRQAKMVANHQPVTPGCAKIKTGNYFGGIRELNLVIWEH